MTKLRVVELFGGIGACSKALKRLKIDFEIVDYVEIDKYAVKSFNALHNTNFETQDICSWNKNLKDIDLVVHGSPCQDISLAGVQKGADKNSGTRSSLMYETIRIVEQLKPKFIIWENVKNLLSKKHSHNFDNYLEAMKELGYNNYYKVLNARDYGIPQNRERVFTISIRKDIDKGSFLFPEKQELKIKLSNLLEEHVDEKYYLDMNAINKIIYENHPNEKETIYIKNNTKKGYLKAHNGDGCYISNIDKKRGTVQQNMIPTLKTSLDIGVVVDDKSTESVGQVFERRQVEKI